MRNWLLFGLLATSLSHADWQLAPESELTFLSTKNTSLTEIHRFRSLSGTLSTTGQASLSIDLTSIDSGIPVRDERMQKFLFETSRFTQATLTTVVDPEVLKKAAGGDIQRINLTGKLSLHGNEEDVNVPVLVVPASNGSIVVSSLQPVLIHAENFALAEGIRTLRDIAKLETIAEVVPVSFTLTFAPVQQQR